MIEGAADISDVLLPPEDGAVARALGELEAKVSRWTAAVAQVHTALAQQVERLAATESTGQVAGSIPDEAAESSDEFNDLLQSAEGDGYQTQAFIEPSESVAVEEVGRDVAESAAASPEFSDRHESLAVEDQEEASVDEDEALLQTLDEKMADAIRVRYRLFNGRKSIRDLIDEYEEPREEPQKTWWQRVKG